MADTTKREVIQMLERMADDASLEDIMYELYFRSRVERGLKEIAEDRLVPHEEVVRKIKKKWPASTGR